MQRFKGFTAGKQQQIALPAQFFDELLLMIDDAAELKVTLFCFQALHQKQGQYRYLTLADFTGHTPLMAGLQALDKTEPSGVILSVTLEKMIKRGTLLFTEVNISEDVTRLYFMNTARGREAIQQLKAGAWQLDAEQHFEILPQRPNIFTLYEENIGLLTPLIADELTDAEKNYPDNWLIDAIKLATEHNKRSWRYIHAILKRWQQEGKNSHETPGGTAGENGVDYAGGRFADIIES